MLIVVQLVSFLAHHTQKLHAAEITALNGASYSL
jgi:hypothetical protein